jgi:hypothetical protein
VSAPLNVNSSFNLIRKVWNTEPTATRSAPIAKPTLRPTVADVKPEDHGISRTPFRLFTKRHQIAIRLPAFAVSSCSAAPKPIEESP